MTPLLLRALLVAFLVLGTTSTAFGKQPDQATNAFLRQGSTNTVEGPPTAVNQKSSSSSSDADTRFAVQYPIEQEALQESTTGNVLSYGHGRCDLKVTTASRVSMEPKGAWWGARYSDLLYV
jgi:hypothetical protein